MTLGVIMRSFAHLPPGRDRADDPAEAALNLWRPTETQASSLVSLGAIWLFFRRNLWMLCAVSAASALLAFGVSHFLLTKYVATAVLIVDPRAAKVTRAGGVISNLGGDAIAIESFVQIARSEGFLGELVDELDLTHDSAFIRQSGDQEKDRVGAIDKLASKLTVSRRGTTYVIDITAISTSAQAAAKIANAAAAKILKDQKELRSGISATTAREIESRLSELRGRVSRAEEAAAELKARLKVTAAGQGHTLLERRISELNQQLVLASARTAETRAQYDLLRKSGNAAGDSLPQAVQSPVLISLRSEYARLSRQSADQMTVLGPRHPEVISLNAQIADMRRQIAAEIRRMVNAGHTALLEAEQREADLSRQLKAAQTESGELGPQTVKLDELEREAKAERGVYEELLNRERELLQVKDLEPSDIRIASRATPPTKPTPGRMILVIGSSMFGLLVGLSSAIVREWRRRTVRTISQASRLCRVDAQGFLPKLAEKQRRDAEVPDLRPWMSGLCAELDLSGGRSTGYVLHISSARKGEGRSTVAINLSAYLSERGERVLLIEADEPSHLRRPPHGLLEILASGQNLKSAFVEQRADGYTLLPYGGRRVKSRNSIGALMSSVALSATLKVARKWFDVIVIDGPPALDAPHARFLAAQADQTLFLMEWDKTDIADAEAALERLELKEAAVVFNKTDAARLRLYDPAQAREIESIGLAA